MKTSKQQIITRLQEVYFDVSDLLEGEIPIGYENVNEEDDDE